MSILSLDSLLNVPVNEEEPNSCRTSLCVF